MCDHVSRGSAYFRAGIAYSCEWLTFVTGRMLEVALVLAFGTKTFAEAAKPATRFDVVTFD